MQFLINLILWCGHYNPLLKYKTSGTSEPREDFSCFNFSPSKIFNRSVDIELEEINCNMRSDLTNNLKNLTSIHHNSCVFMASRGEWFNQLTPFHLLTCNEFSQLFHFNKISIVMLISHKCWTFVCKVNVLCT